MSERDAPALRVGESELLSLAAKLECWGPASGVCCRLLRDAAKGIRYEGPAHPLSCVYPHGLYTKITCTRTCIVVRFYHGRVFSVAGRLVPFSVASPGT